MLYYSDPRRDFLKSLEIEQAMETSAGYEKIGEGSDENIIWYDLIIRDHFNSLQYILDYVGFHANHSILEAPLHNYMQSPLDSNLNAQDILEGIDGIHIYEFTDFQAGTHYNFYLSYKKKKAVYRKLEKIVSAIRKHLDKNGYTVAFLEKQINMMEKENIELKRKVRYLEQKPAIKNKNITGKLPFYEQLMRAEMEYLSILNYLNSPTEDFFCIGPVLCSRADEMYVIIKCEMYRLRVYSNYAILLALISHNHKYLKVIEYNRDGSLPKSGRFAVGFFISRTYGWNYEKAILKCSGPDSVSFPYPFSNPGLHTDPVRYRKYKDPNVIRSEYIAWLKKKQDKIF